MKTSNYLIALAALTSLTLVGCSDNDFLGSGSGPEGQGAGTNGQLSFAAGGGKITRGEITGEDAAKKLGNKFTVYGWKQVNANSDATPAFQDVFQDYVVEWKGAASAGSSETNTRGWEYVGGTSQPVDGSQPYEQTIKYWDWSTDRYDFQAWSIYNSNAQILSRNTVNDYTTPTDTPPELEFFAPTAKDLGGVYVSDKFTSVPADAMDAASWDTEFDGGLANVISHTGKEYHVGNYSQEKLWTEANSSNGVVNLQFRNLAAKVRIGIYETIPGYKVSDVVFYERNATNNYSYTWHAPNSSTDVPYYTSDMNADYTADETYATLFGPTFGRRGNVKIKYHDSYYNGSYATGDIEEKDNVAYTDITATGENFFAFGQLTNERGSETPIDYTAGEVIGTTSNTASMSIGNDDDHLYTYVFPMEKNATSLELKVNYLLTSIDGSGEQIRITGANATVPVEFAKWRSNYAYTYLFKISDNTNGYTAETGVEGLYPITFDACLVNTEDGFQETITTVNNKSITTYQDGSKVTKYDAYVKAETNPTTDRNIYFTVEDAAANTILTLNNTSSGTGQNVWLYTAYAEDEKIITEEAVADYKNNKIVLTDVSNLLSFPTSASNSSGAKYAIQFGEGKVAAFAPVAKFYVVKAISDGDTTYKVIKVQDGSEAKTYAITLAAPSINNNASTTFTINNSATGSVGKVTGAKGAIDIYDSSTKVNDKFSIVETADYTYTITAIDADGTDEGKSYTIKLSGASDATLKVKAPAWSDASINIEEGHSGNVTLVDAAESSTKLTGVKPTVTKAATAKGSLNITEAAGTYTITPAEGSYGTFTVSYHGANLTVNVDLYKLALSRAIINKGDEENKTATLTLTNESNSTGKTAVTGITISATKDGSEPAQDIVTLNSTTAPSTGTITVTAAKAGTSTISANNAQIQIEVVDITLKTETAHPDGVKRVSLKNNATDTMIDGATFTIVKGDSGDSGMISVSGTTDAGIYKVTGGSSAKSYTIQYKYKGVVIADVSVTM